MLAARVRCVVPHARSFSLKAASAYLEPATKMGIHGLGPGELNQPRSIAITPNGEMFVSEFANERISVFSPSGGYERTLWLQRQGRPGRPSRLTTNHAGHLVVTDSRWHCVHVLCPSTGDVITSFGSKGHDEGKLFWPRGVAVMSDGTFVVGPLHYITPSPHAFRIHMDSRSTS